ncbi:MAG: DUF4365 domain-containing protein [Nitrospiraceae bacterium]|nr:DUF4365 domain-containing protein [Nitrospiraceae bacterium]
MSAETKNFPNRPRTHVVATTSLNSFKAQSPQEWIIEESQYDYGWDLNIEIPEGESVTGLGLFVQLKGSDKPDYINKNQDISLPLEVTTVNYLLAKPLPTMVALCDTKRNSFPVYWVWIKEEIKRIETTTPNWQDQQTVSLRIPVSQRLSGQADIIFEYVRNFNEGQQVNAKIQEWVIGNPTTGVHPDFSGFTGQSPKVILERAKNVLEKTGIIEVFEDEAGEKTKTLSDEDRQRVEKIRKAASYLENRLDQQAQVILDEIATEIPGATDGIRAKYYNIRGVLALHMDQRENAIQFFNQAVQLRPNEKVYICNQLGIQFVLYFQKVNHSGENFPSDWLERLEALLGKNPDFTSAIRLKAYYIGETENADRAKIFLENSPAWNQDPISTRLCLAEIYKDAGENTKALSTIEEAETLDCLINPWLLSLKGLVQLLMALGKTAKVNESIRLNFRTKILDLNQLYNSYNSYLKALTEYSISGFPLTSAPAIGNFSNVACMLEKTEKAEDFCKQFLEKHQDNKEIQKALAGLYVFKGQSSKAIPYLKKQHRGDKKNSTVYKNLILALLVAEEFESLLETIEMRQDEGFQDNEEEGLSRTLAAMAFAELGETARAFEQVQILKNDNNFVVESITAEAEVVSRAFGDKDKASEVYLSGIFQYPDDFNLLTRYSCHLGSPNAMTAEEVVKVNEHISIQNQLAPEQYLWLIKGYLLLGEPEKAAEASRQAIGRYPEDDRFLFMQANVLLSLGDELGAYNCVQEYIKKEKTYSSLLEGARLARDIGKEDNAIKLFELAKDRTTDSKELCKIHCQLYVLKKRRGDQPKIILRHAMKFGENTQGDIEKEVQFFMMVMMCPKGLDENDLEIKKWLKETHVRIDTFVNAHPHHPSFRRIQWSEGESFQKHINNILSDMVALSLPYELSTTSLRLSARDQILPLFIRRQIFLETKSLFWFWELCTESDEFAYAIHIWGNENRMEDEVRVAQSTNKICIDITGLLTLAEFDLLNLLTEKFQQIFLVRETRNLVDKGFLDPVCPHPLAQKIHQWRLAHLSQIRIRTAPPPVDAQEHERENGKPFNVSDKTKRPLHNFFGDGIGESISLAQKLSCPLYTDEGILRGELSRHFEIQCLGSLGFLTHLKQSGEIPEGRAIELMAKMIAKNFKHIPFSSENLSFLLKEILLQHSDIPNSQTLSEHSVLGVFLRQFGDTSVDIISLYFVAVEWWVKIILDPNVPNQVLPECMEVISGKLTIWRTIGGVLSSVPDEPEQMAATLWASFLWKCHRIGEQSKAYEAWLAINECCARLFRDHYSKQQKIKFTLIPEKIIEIANKDICLKNTTQRVTCFVNLTLEFPQGNEDREILEDRFRDLARRLN